MLRGSPDPNRREGNGSGIRMTMPYQKVGEGKGRDGNGNLRGAAEEGSRAVVQHRASRWGGTESLRQRLPEEGMPPAEGHELRYADGDARVGEPAHASGKLNRKRMKKKRRTLKIFIKNAKTIE